MCLELWEDRWRKKQVDNGAIMVVLTITMMLAMIILNMKSVVVFYKHSDIFRANF